jgi:1,6-anhydro-N-acetylmuramate kinase
VKSIEEFGLPAQAKEPLAFGFFGLRRLLNKVNHIPACTGAKKQVILGVITPA